MYTFDLRPSIKTTLTQAVPELNLQAGTPVNLERSSLNGRLLRFVGTNRWFERSYFDLSEQTIKNLDDQVTRSQQEVVLSSKHKLRTIPPRSPARK